MFFVILSYFCHTTWQFFLYFFLSFCHQFVMKYDNLWLLDFCHIVILLPHNMTIFSLLLFVILSSICHKIRQFLSILCYCIVVIFLTQHDNFSLLHFLSFCCQFVTKYDNLWLLVFCCIIICLFCVYISCCCWLCLCCILCIWRFQILDQNKNLIILCAFHFCLLCYSFLFLFLSFCHQFFTKYDNLWYFCFCCIVILLPHNMAFFSLFLFCNFGISL